MSSQSLHILAAKDVEALLHNRERDILELIKHAYIIHRRGASSLPHSVFLRFPDNQQDRIIALPAYLGDDINVAGIKWISSFPGNLSQGLDRASAAIILNSAQTGHPCALLEGSIISAKRTAASAALAAATLHGPDATHALLVGCGVINFEILRFLKAVYPQLVRATVYDLSRERAEQFCQRASTSFAQLEMQVADTLPGALAQAALVSFATTAGTPYLHETSAFAPRSTVLHISLRDLGPSIILAADNVVDDVDHVCRAQTSIHLASQQHGSSDFVRCTLADIFLGDAPARLRDDRPVIFSPFGLGVLDLILAKDIYDQALAKGAGVAITGFLPQSWQQSKDQP